MSKLLCLYSLIFLFFLFHINTSSATKNFNVLDFGAKPDGETNSTQAFHDTWIAACSSIDSTLILVPRGTYLLDSMDFKGSCKSPNIIMQIDGYLVGPGDYRILGQSKSWLRFENVYGVSIVGGILDARGKPLWDCKAKSSDCPNGATSLMFTNSDNINLNGLTSLNSQLYHIVINGCQNVHVEGVTVKAPGDSPNTDGIHVQFSTDVVIMNSNIGTGDDCIPVGAGTKNLWIQEIYCGPGHGISIGSLGKDIDKQKVQNVTVKNSTFENTTNGLRIKSWDRPSNGFVREIRFIGAIMKNVQNPIIIDQHYCPQDINCTGQESGIKISDVRYQDIQGTSATKVAINFNCSSTNPCREIVLQNIDLTCLNKIGQSSCAESVCDNVFGEVFGVVRPKSCF